MLRVHVAVIATVGSIDVCNVHVYVNDNCSLKSTVQYLPS